MVEPFNWPCPNLAISRYFHFRDKDGAQVDIVLERSARGLAGSRFLGGVVLYDGETRVPFGDGLFAVPIRSLWEPLS